MSAHRTPSAQAMVASRIEQLEREMNAHTVWKSKSGRWKTQKGRRGTIIRNWCMDSSTGGVVSSNPAPTHVDPFHQYYQPFEHPKQRDYAPVPQPKPAPP